MLHSNSNGSNRYSSSLICRFSQYFHEFPNINCSIFLRIYSIWLQLIWLMICIRLAVFLCFVIHPNPTIVLIWPNCIAATKHSVLPAVAKSSLVCPEHFVNINWIQHTLTIIDSMRLRACSTWIFERIFDAGNSVVVRITVSCALSLHLYIHVLLPIALPRNKLLFTKCYPVHDDLLLAAIT